MKNLQSVLLLLLVFSSSVKVLAQDELDPQINKGVTERNRFFSRKTPSYNEQNFSFFFGMNWNTTFENETPLLYDLDRYHDHPKVPFPVGYFFMNAPAHFELFPALEIGLGHQLRNENRGLQSSIRLTQNRFYAKTKVISDDIHSELHFKGQELRILFIAGPAKYIGPWQINLNSIIGIGINKQYSLESRHWNQVDGTYFQVSDGLKGEFYKSDFTFGLGVGVAYSISNSWSIGIDYHLYKVKSGNSVKEPVTLADEVKKRFNKQGYWNHGFSLQFSYCFKRKTIVG